MGKSKELFNQMQEEMMYQYTDDDYRYEEWRRNNRERLSYQETEVVSITFNKDKALNTILSSISTIVKDYEEKRK
jgi:cell fate (sporulation/competence/biofilm development) regulator YlbF (YheA/YmcA/DUF963 family)